MRIAAHTLNVPVAPILSIRIGSKNVPSAAPIRLNAMTIPTPVPLTRHQIILADMATPLQLR